MPPRFRTGTQRPAVEVRAVTSRPIEIAVALVSRADGRTLLVRKRGTSTFIQPGGKIEPREQAAAAVCREVYEELGLHIVPGDLTYLGRFEDVAVNEPGTVIAEAFSIVVDAHVTAAAEIEELVWIDPASPGNLTIAPLTRDQLLPLLV
jgi:8-oxo-dGTP diphosphatase